jgi:hypothetical protein
VNAAPGETIKLIMPNAAPGETIANNAECCAGRNNYAKLPNVSSETIVLNIYMQSIVSKYINS